jgi:hypothetical protein
MATDYASKPSWPAYDGEANNGSYGGHPRNIAYIDALKLDPNLTPTTYHIEGTCPGSKILFLGVNILDSTGREPFYGDVLIEGKN